MAKIAESPRMGRGLKRDVSVNKKMFVKSRPIRSEKYSRESQSSEYKRKDIDTVAFNLYLMKTKAVGRIVLDFGDPAEILVKLDLFAKVGIHLLIARAAFLVRIRSSV